MEIYFAKYKKVKNWLDAVGRQTLRQGYVRTLGGRKRKFSLPDKSDMDYTKLISSIERQGKNMPIQGTSADITKFALLFVYREMIKKKLDAHLVHTVHDEIVVEAKSEIADDTAKLVEEQMIKAGERLLKKVPVKVDVHVSTCWEK